MYGESMVKQIQEYINSGVYDQNRIFKELYPKWNGHYSVLRDMIAKEKNR
jgi:hypothetical protein